MQKIIHRIFQYIDYKGVPHTRFEKEIGLSNGYLNTQLRRNADIGESVLQRFIDNSLDVNVEWLITGNGSMLVNAKKPLNSYNASPPTGIPLIPIEAMAGYGNGEFVVDDNSGIERFVVPTFKGADYLISVKGSSMYPKYNSGDIVACKKLNINDIFFQWNKVYVLDTEQGALIKRVCKAKDDKHILCVSDNNNYGSFELHRSKINAIAIVMGVIRLE